MGPERVELLAVRHGETAWNVERRIQGQGDSPLTARGVEQADALAARLAEERVAAIWSSDLARARDTARRAAARTGLEVRLDPGLRERSYGLFEGLTWDEIQARFPEAWARHRTGDPAWAVPGGESLLELRDRVVAALRRIAEAAAREADRRCAAGGAVEEAGALVRVAVVTHGGALDVLYRAAMGLAPGAPRGHAMPNAGIHRLRLEEGRPVVVAWAEVEHLAGGRSRDDESV